jgi:hypothetical protein
MFNRQYIIENLRGGLLTEKIFDIDEDVNLLYVNLLYVNLLYDKYFKTDIDNIIETGIVLPSHFRTSMTKTSILTPSDSIKANELNPCKILTNFNRNTNSYHPKLKEIRVGVNVAALDFLKDYDGNILLATKQLPNNLKTSFYNEFSEVKIKGSIHHELNHWIDDSLHNQYLSKTLDKAQEKGYDSVFKDGVDTTFMEIQGQLGNIKQLKNKYNDVWDNLTTDDLFKLSPTLFTIHNSLKDKPDIRKTWLRNLKTRMYREGLLGVKMR